MTRKTLKELRSAKGDKWAKIYAELSKMVEAPAVDQKVVYGTATVYNATPGGTVTTGLSAISGLTFSVMSPVTPDYLVVNASPAASGNFTASCTPVDAKISYTAWGTA